MKMQNLKVLSNEEIKMIHDASIKILVKSGVIVDNEKVLDILEKSGCMVDHNTMGVKFTENIIKKSLQTVPSSIELCDREGNTSLILGDGKVKCASGHNAVFMLSENGSDRRNSYLKDVEDFAIISDYLSEIDIVGVPTTPSDVETKTSLLYSVKALLENTKKPIYFSSDSSLINKAIIEMGKTILNKDSLAGCCNMISQVSPTSPLYWEKDTMEALYTVASEGMPLSIIPAPITGLTSPYTITGLLTLLNTEALSGIIISQIINPNTPVIYAAAWMTYDMKQASITIGRPEASILRVAGAQMAHFYKIPSHSIAPDSDSNIMDEQNSWEKMLSAVSAMTGGQDLIVNCGMFSAGMTVSLEQLVLDNEICRIVRRFMEGMEVNDETIASDVIISVGPKNNYLTQNHTLKFLRSNEHVKLDLINQPNYEIWKTTGKADIVSLAKDKVKELVSMGSKSKLDPKIEAELSKIIKNYEQKIL